MGLVGLTRSEFDLPHVPESNPQAISRYALISGTTEREECSSYVGWVVFKIMHLRAIPLLAIGRLENASWKHALWPFSAVQLAEAKRRPGQQCTAVLDASMRRVILVVEDEAILLMVAVSVLQDAGYDTVSAGTVAQAVAIIENPEQKLDLLFTDLGLADQSDGGLAVGQTMAKFRPGLPVVYTTGRRVAGGVAKLFVAPNKFIPKPYTDNQLVSAAADLLQAQR
jgi:two-component system, response regulator PdtaR